MQLLDAVRLGGKAVGVHHGNLCAQVVAHLVELLPLQVSGLQTIILDCDLLFLVQCPSVGHYTRYGRHNELGG